MSRNGSLSVERVANTRKHSPLSGGTFVSSNERSAPVARRSVRPRSKPTPRQLEVLRYIASSLRARAIPPTIREICERFGWASTIAAVDHLAALERKGLVTRIARVARGLMISEAGAEALRPSR